MNKILGLLSLFFFSIAQIGMVSAATDVGGVACSQQQTATAAEALVQMAAQGTATADPASATIVTALVDGPQAGCSLCLENCIIDCISSGGSNCGQICRVKCRNEGPPC